MPGAKSVANFKLRINHATTARCEVQVWLDGDLLGSLNMRNAQLPLYILALKPVEIAVDRENVTDDLRRRVRGFKELSLF